MKPAINGGSPGNSNDQSKGEEDFMTKRREELILNVFSRADMTSERSLELRASARDIKTYVRDLKQTELWSERAERILRFFADYDGGYFLPEKCDVYEPERERFDPQDLSVPVGWLSQVGGSVRLKKSRVPKYSGYIDNKRFPPIWQKGGLTPMKPSVGEPVFLTHLCFWIDAKIVRMRSMEFLRRFLVDLFRTLEGDFGFLTMTEDYAQKNFLVTVEKCYSTRTTRERYVGDNPETCLPGVYWINLFGRLYVEWFGEGKFESIPCFYKEKLPNGGYLIQCAENMRYFETDEAQRVKAIKDHFGGEAFFEIKELDRICTVPNFGGQTRA